LSTYFEHKGSGTERTLAAGLGDQFSGTAQKPAEAVRGFKSYDGILEHCWE
jgi:hypothetical protein